MTRTRIATQRNQETYRGSDRMRFGVALCFSGEASFPCFSVALLMLRARIEQTSKVTATKRRWTVVSHEKEMDLSRR